MAIFYQSGGDVAVNMVAANDVGWDTGSLRLLCRPSHAPTLRPVWVMDGNQAPTGVADYGPVYWLRDLASHRTITPERMQARTAAAARFAGDSYTSIFRSLNSGARQSGLELYFAGSWTLDIEVAFGNVANTGYIANCRTVAAVDAGKVFDVTWNGSGVKTFTINFYSYSAPTLTTYTATLDASAWAFSSNKYYDFRLTFDRANSLFKAELRDPATDARVTVTKTGATAVNAPTGFDCAPLIIGGILTESGGGGTTLAGACGLAMFQRASLYASFLDTGLPAIAARPTFYAATTTGDADGVSALATLDSGADGSLWDLSTLTPNDISIFAAPLGAGGWEARYQITNAAAPTAWSAWMSLATLKVQADAAGHYLHLGLRATSDGYNEFYPLAWISCEAATYPTPDAPVISNFARAVTTGTVDVAGVTAGNVAEVYAVSKLDTDADLMFAKVGEQLNGGTIPLDFTLFSVTIFALTLPLPVSIFCLERNPAGCRSEPSNCLGSLIGDSAGVAVAGPSIAGGILTFTLSGLTNPTDLFVVFYYDILGNLRVQSFTGNGVKTWNDGFGGGGYEFIGIPVDNYGKLLLPPISFEVAAPAGGTPYMRPRRAPGLEDV